MKLNRKYLIDLACSNDDLREAMMRVVFYKSKKLAVATNGMILAIVPYEPDANEPEEMYLSGKALKELRKANGSGKKILVDTIFYDSDTNSVFAPTDPSIKYNVGKGSWEFPDWESVLNWGPSKAHFSFNLELLTNLAQSVGAKKDSPVMLHLYPNGNQAYVTTEEDISDRTEIKDVLERAGTSGVGLLAGVRNDIKSKDPIEEKLNEVSEMFSIVTKLLAERNIQVQFEIQEGRLTGKLAKIPVQTEVPA